MPTLIAVTTRTVLVARHTQRWHLSAPLSGHRFTSAAADPHTPGRAYCGTVNGGLWRTDNGGESWEDVGAGPGSAHVTAVAVDRHERSGGAKWRRISDGLPASDGTVVSHFATTGEPGVFYAANNRGMFLSTDAGQRWTSLDLQWDHQYETEGVQALLALAD